MSSAEHLAAEDKINAEMDSKIQAAEETYKARIGELIQGIIQAFAGSNPEQANLVQGLLANLDLQEQVNQIYEGLQNETIDPAQAQAALQSIYDKMFGDGVYTAEMPGQAVKDLSQRLGSQIGEAMEQLDPSDLGLVDTLNELLSGEAGAALDVDTSGMEGVFRAAMVAVGSAGADGLTEGIQAQQETVNSAATETGQGVEEAIKAALGEDTFVQVGEAVGQGLTNGVESKKAPLLAKARTITSATTSTVKSGLSLSTFKEIGQNIGQGLINGMDSKLYAVKAKAAQLARAAEQGVKEAGEIHSPSRVMARLGGYTADGFILGIESKMDAVQRTVRSMVSTDGLQTTRGNASPEGQRVRSAQQTTVNIKYSGAFTQREARRFGREFALQIASDNAGRGG